MIRKLRQIVKFNQINYIGVINVVGRTNGRIYIEITGHIDGEKCIRLYSCERHNFHLTDGSSVKVMETIIKFKNWRIIHHAKCWPPSRRGNEYGVDLKPETKIIQ